MTLSLGMSIVRPFIVAAMAVLAILASAGSGNAAGMALAPQTKVRVTVVQWMPISGAYEQWSALGGEFTVSDEGTLALPVIGPVPVGTLDGVALGAEISRLLQERLGTVEKPDTTVEVVEYPPVYVVGNVKQPGAYAYRAGLTVLQALALAGGDVRPGAEQTREQIRLVGELRSLDNERLRTTARIARLRAEMDKMDEIDFPLAPADGAGKALAAEVFAQERMIFLARANELDRQTRSLTELRELLNAEIDVLEQKIAAADAGIAAVEKELDGVKILVERGIAIASRQSDLERSLASYRAERLDQVTAIMRARQAVAEATRNLDGLLDRQQTEVASDLQREQTSLDQLVLRREVAQKLLLDILASAGAAGPGESAATFSITRREAGAATEIPAVESSALQPGDVVKIEPAAAPDAAAQEVSQ